MPRTVGARRLAYEIPDAVLFQSLPADDVMQGTLPY